MKRFLSILVMASLILVTFTSCNIDPSEDDGYMSFGTITTYNSATSFIVTTDNYQKLYPTSTIVSVDEDNLGDRVLVSYSILNPDYMGYKEVSIKAMIRMDIFQTETLSQINSLDEESKEEFWENAGDNPLKINTVLISGGYFNIEYVCPTSVSGQIGEGDHPTLVYNDDESTENTIYLDLYYKTTGIVASDALAISSFTVNDFFPMETEEYKVVIRYNDYDGQAQQVSFTYDPDADIEVELNL